MKNREPDEINVFGTKFWYDDNRKWHNDNGYPAVIYCDGTKYWCNHGSFHNDYGPAQIWADGDKRWWIDDIYYTEEEFLQHKIKQFIYNE